MKKNGTLFCLFLLIHFHVFCQRHTGNTKSDIVPEATTQSLAADSYASYLARNMVLDSTPDNELIQKVGKRVIQAIKNYYTQKKKSNELKDFHWEIRLVDKKDINTWCLPGGRINVCAGLLTFTQNEASLAVALSHQIAHVLAKHGNERLKQLLHEFMGDKTLPEALSARPSDTKDIFEMAYGINHIGVTPPFSQQNEIEADRLGLMFTGLAGYNPREALVFWERMAQLSRTARKPELLGVHLVTDERMTEMENIVDDMIKKYYKPANKS